MSVGPAPELPRAYVVSSTSRQLTVQCPFCPRQHYHGALDDLSLRGPLGHKQVHCADPYRSDPRTVRGYQIWDDRA